MKRSGDIRWGELRLGLLIFVALAVFLWASIQGGANLFKKQHVLHSEFPNVQGVVSGAPVWFQGVEVGTVKDLDFIASGDSSKVRITFTVDAKVWPLVRADSKVKIQALNLFGEKFMEVTSGSRGAAPVKDGATLASERPTDVTQLMARAEHMVDDLSATTKDLKEMTARIRRGEGTLGKLANSDEMHDNLVATISQVRVLTANLDRSQVEMTRSLTAAANSLDSVMAMVESGNGSLGRMVRDPELYDNLASLSGRMDSTMGRVERGEGSLGRLTKDDAMAVNLEKSLDQLNKLLADLQANPKKYFKFSVF